ncbi:sulfatase [Pelagicoccus sp. NFK12]|uniref:Sulfatase n=1 Tax=Pelagicoccus enzymogenes TaxID=2773457 RepID=A0A927F3X3_9BACT|nr:sulfatase [Pelagicoccus enzymogenes]MBD5777962.1 sulfatase [Pelagicoccus enzymogenes]
MTPRLIIGLAPLAASIAFNFASQASDRPNVLFIIADDLNHYGFSHEQAGIQTPHFDTFRKSAVTFPNAVCNAPSCVPSRASFLSGLYPYSTGSYLNGSDPWTKPAMDEIVSLPEIFKQAGYITWGSGKVFHTKITPERKEAAFDNEPWAGDFGPFLKEEDQMGSKWWGAGAWDGPDTDFPDVVNAEKAIAFLNEVHDRPFFMVLGLWRPHTPFTAPQRFFDQYDRDTLPFPPASFQSGDLDDVPQQGIELSRVWGERWIVSGESDKEKWRDILWGYAATTSFADDTTGRVIEALDASPYADNTIVIFVSDNGYHVGEKEHFEKSTLWSASARVPFAIRLPGKQNAAAVSDATVGLIDIYPTLVDYCSLPQPPQGTDGLSMRPALEQPSYKWDRPAITVYEVDHFSATDGSYRYIRYGDGSEELYDHSSDPHEFENLADEPRLAGIKRRFQKWIPERWAPSLGGRQG